MRLPVSLAAAFVAASTAAAAGQTPDAVAAHARAMAMAAREEARAAVHAYQGRDRGSEQTERFSRKVKLGRDGRVSLQNISGDIVVTGGSGDEVSIDAVKRGRDRSQFGTVNIVVDDRGGRVDVRTEYQASRNNNVSVDYTVTVPSSATLEVKSVSGNVKVTGIQGLVRAESVSGNVTTAQTPRLEAAKSVSGDVTLTDAGADADLSAGSVSGNVHAKGLKARSIDVNTVSGDVVLTDVTCDRFGIKSVSGDVEFSGPLARNGRYDVNSHSGDVRLALAGATGFELNATTFSGSVRSELPLTIGGDPDAARTGGRHRGPSNRNMHATFGDGSAMLTLRTFSGDIVITKR